MITFEIVGKPMPKERPKHGRGHSYTPKKTVDHEAAIARIARDHFDELISGPVYAKIEFVFKPAKSWSKKKRAAAMGKFHTQTPDKDNLEKSVLDALNGIAYHDDRQVAFSTSTKVWGEEAKTIVSIMEIKE